MNKWIRWSPSRQDEISLYFADAKHHLSHSLVVHSPPILPEAPRLPAAAGKEDQLCSVKTYLQLELSL